MSEDAFKFDYDKESDSLFIYNSKYKSTGSVQLGSDVIVDFREKVGVVGLEVLDASAYLTESSGEPITRETLENLKSAQLSIKTHKGLIFVVFYLSFKSPSRHAIKDKITLTEIDYHSPVLATA